MGRNSGKKIYISLGSNLGNRAKNLANACKLLNEKIGQLELKSDIYETEPWGFESTNPFLNQVVCLNSTCSANKAMELILTIENEMGRTRNKEKYSSRVIDIDILFYGNHIIHQENIEIPHPRLHERRFVLIPLVDVAPDFVHPVFGSTVSKLLNECEDMLKVKSINRH